MSIRYRPDIDGLRAVAILGVLIYHAQFAFGDGIFLPGGAFGVDVFFVISGFLITSILLRELEETKTISLTNFYIRRIRRILPALLVVMLLCIPIAWILLLPSQLIDFVYSMVSSVFSVSNVYWLQTLQEYEAESALLKPLLHTWSLAVEEQYYLLAPVLLLWLSRWKRTIQMLFLGVLFAASLLFAVHMTERNMLFSFYMLPSRFWEILAGGLLAMWCVWYRKEKQQWWTYVLPSVGLAFILYSFFFVDALDGHPGVVTLLPVIGTVLLICFAKPQEWVTRLLSHRLLVGIGLLSYSLYLWHYPVLVFARMSMETLFLAEKIFLLLLTLCLSIGSYVLVEQPFRHKKHCRTKVCMILLLCMVSIALSFAYAVHASEGARHRFHNLTAMYGKVSFDNRMLQRKVQKYGDNILTEQESRGETSFLRFEPGVTRVLIAGDSHARDVFHMLHATAHLYPTYEFVRSKVDIQIPWMREDFLASQDYLHADIVFLVYKKRIVSFYEEEFPLFDAFMKTILQDKEKVSFVARNVELPDIEGKRFADWHIVKAAGRLPHNEINLLAYRMKKQYPKQAALIAEIAERYGVPLIQREHLVCDTQRQMCHVFTPDGYKVYFDTNHYTLKGAEFLGLKAKEINWLQLD